MGHRKEELFKLQVFQETISTYYMYPLRIYKNNCYQNFLDEIINNDDLEKLRYHLSQTKNTSIDEVITKLKNKIKNEPKSIQEDSELYKLLDKYAEKLIEYMWETHPSNSLTFIRQVKEDRRIWIFLMIYDLFPCEFIDDKFENLYITKCLINMKSIYIKLNEEYTLSVGRLFSTIMLPKN
ncbi:MAG: Unknown protein [uncultured Sulfurovum sp.]|uniref:Uncharacterized protein n=1 Tax=uncultured Sulfurovum sp. TaxID=269237 RepID=A0A6S6RT72_9BACT|nr:MAG: Unknown protein [uncultured Sulfurovum sp.]